MNSSTLITAKDGKVLGVDPNRLWVHPYFLMTNSSNTNGATPILDSLDNDVIVPANGTFGPVFMGVSAESPIRLTALASDQSAGPFTLMLQTQSGGQQVGLMNSAIHSSTILGTGGKPYKLPEALNVPAGLGIEATFFDLSGSNNTVRLAFQGMRMSKPQVTTVSEQQQSQKDPALSLPFWYTMDNGPAALPAYTPGSPVELDYIMTISSAHNFQLTQFSAIVVRNSDNTQQPYAFNLTDTTTGETLIDAPQGSTYGINGALLFGTGSFPFKFHEPRMLLAGARMEANITNLDPTGAACTAYLTFGGRALAIKGWR